MRDSRPSHSNELPQGPDWHRLVSERLASCNLDPAQESDIAEELAQHLDDRYNELLASSLHEPAVRELLDRELAELVDVSRESWGISSGRAALTSPSAGNRKLSMGVIADTLIGDIRYAWRGLLRAPVFTTVAVVSLAFGIGATTAAFSLLHTLLLERLALPHAEQLVLLRSLSQATPNGGPGPIARDSVPTFYALTTYDRLRRAGVSPSVEGWDGRRMKVVPENGAPDFDVMVDMVTGGWFDLLGARALVGRTLTPNDERNAMPVAVISANYWRSHFGADSNIIGRHIEVGQAKLTVVGVMPESFRGLYFGRAFNIAVPAAVSSSVVGVESRALGKFLFATRLDKNGTPATTKAKLESALAAGGKPETLTVSDISRGETFGTLRRDYRTYTFLLVGGVGILLLIACANVGTMLLGRAMAREREMAIRLALGANATRIARQLFVDSFLLAVLGGTAGLFVARAATTMIARRLPANADVIAELVPLQPSPAVLLVAAGAMVLVTLLVGSLPALLASRADLRTSLSGRVHKIFPRWRAEHVLVAAQIALGLVLVSAASSFVATLRTLTERQGGYRTTNIVLGEINLHDTPYMDEPSTTLDRVLDIVRHADGVAAAGIGSAAPLVATVRMGRMIKIAGATEQPDHVKYPDMVAATPGYFAATGMRILAGRDFTSLDRFESRRVAVLSEALARRYGNPASLIGRTLTIDTTSMRIVGVVSDARQPQFERDRRTDVRGASTDCFYLPLAQLKKTLERVPTEVMVIRTDRDPGFVAGTARRAIIDALPGLRIERMRTVTQVLDDALPRERLSVAISVMLGTLALLLAAVGVAGIVGYDVVQRTTEIGVRLALGARPIDAWALVLRHMLVVASLGVIAGIPLAYGAGKLIGAQLFGVSGTDPRVLAGAAAVLLASATAAAFWPAFRAARVDPLIALRAE